MRREILDVYSPGFCCPGHDKYPSSTYKSNRSKKARSAGKKKEHRHARRVKKVTLALNMRDANRRHSYKSTGGSDE